jgi:mannose-1-phosphate guanylyltransferase
MILETIHRVLPLVGGWSHVLVASGAAVEAATRALLPDLPAENMLVEPIARNTAPCIGWAAATLARKDPDAIVIVLPSDHHVTEVDVFLDALRLAVESARGGTITTIGIQPTRPETGFGYIELKEGAAGPVQEVARFVEKPDRARAQAFVASGRFLWNAGMFIFRARDMLAAMREHLEPLADGLDVFDRAAANGQERAAVEAGFGSLPAVSIDVGVMEKCARLAVVRGDFGWSDVGSWEAAWELAARDADGNAVVPDAIYVDAHNNHVVVGKKVVALVGVDDLVVVDTEDALLVIPRSRSQDVRLIVEALKAKRASSL